MGAWIPSFFSIRLARLYFFEQLPTRRDTAQPPQSMGYDPPYKCLMRKVHVTLPPNSPDRPRRIPGAIPTIPIYLTHFPVPSITMDIVIEIYACPYISV
jgi:hypothetical protein